MLIYTNRQRHAAYLLRKMEKEKPPVKKGRLISFFLIISGLAVAGYAGWEIVETNILFF